jgi:hypothetical protein
MLRRRVLAGCAAGLAVALCGAPEPTPAAAARADAAAAPSFAFSARRLTTALRHRLDGSSWRPGCPVALDDLRYLALSYYGFDGAVHRGHLVVNASAVRAVRTAFADLFAHRFPIRRMHLVDDYGASDYRSIEADNTSAFNCRRATGATRWSEHAYGRAIDLDPLENPYVSGGQTSHAASRPYLDRTAVARRAGVITAGGIVTRAFARIGWGWGGSWSGTRDYQHFSASGR